LDNARTNQQPMGGDAAFWQTRAEQLQQALESRIVIEQAKGVLAERMKCDASAAFDLLRRAARSSRRKLPELAAEVVASAAAGGSGEAARNGSAHVEAPASERSRTSRSRGGFPASRQ
jgi:hypothetical protein